jgi:hypothetical protein
MGKITWKVESDLLDSSSAFHFAHKSGWLLLFNEINEHKETDVIDLIKQINWKSRKWSEYYVQAWKLFIFHKKHYRII